ncbi:choline dehydrogenase, partial [Escherichia coli]|nr:choline dehydrogenase [Escherichia coli]
NTVPNELITQHLLDQGIVGPTLDRLIRHNSARYLKIASYVEVLPDPANRVTLSNRRDALDLPTPRINYDIAHEYTMNAMAR